MQCNTDNGYGKLLLFLRMYDELLTQDWKAIFLKPCKYYIASKVRQVSDTNNEATRDNEDNMFATCLT